MGSLSSFNCGVKYLPCVIEFFTRHDWVKRLADKKAKTVFHGFNGVVKKFKHNPNKLWVNQEKEFYNKLMQKWLKDNDILLYLINNKLSQ